MKFRNTFFLLAAVVSLSSLTIASPVTGTVKNGTTDRPAAGDDVVLLQLSQGMNEQARTKTDAQGHFKFNIDDSDAPHLVRVNHQGVNYFPKGGPLMPGASTVDITVYDVAKRLDNIALTVDMHRYQADAGTLSVTELWAVNNTSSPPRTQMNDFPFKVQLPEGAQVDSSIAAAPGGQPVQSAPVPTGSKNEFAFIFPLRPGETRFQVTYHVPYSGQLTLHPRLDLPAEHVVVMVPKTMQFSPAGGAAFQSMGEEEGAQIQVVTKVQPGQDLSFRLSGTGTIQAGQQGGAPAEGQGGATAAVGRPGGGLGPPEETPDPLHRYRWYILGGLAVALAAGAVYVNRRPGGAVAAPNAGSNLPRERTAIARTSAAPAVSAPAPQSNGSSRILEALKEELFQLEMDRHQGRISDDEYQKAKAALDLTLARAASRAKS